MTLAAPVTDAADGTATVLARGATLEQQHIDAIKAQGARYLYINQKGFEDLDRHLSPHQEISRHTGSPRQVMYQQARDTMNAVQTQTPGTTTYADYYVSAQQFVIALMGQGDRPVYLDQPIRDPHDLAAHSAAVAHLSLLLGTRLERYLVEQRDRLSAQHAKEVTNLAVAGMLHDVGKAKLSPAIGQFCSLAQPKDEADASLYQMHSQLSYDLVHSGIEASAATAILHHHQYFDGSGFPYIGQKHGAAHLRGNEIHVFGRILAAADLYDRLSVPIDAPRRTNLEVLHLMRTTHRAQIDPVILATLHQVCPPYPVGARLGLSTGVNAIVTDINADSPYKPHVKLLKQDGAPDGEEISLAKENAPQIRTLWNVPVTRHAQAARSKTSIAA
jgi:HD-GYP domain-containing protein (c-di-GMP phosphodiesterase class II)